MAHHEVKIMLAKEGVRPGTLEVLAVGDTVRYSSPHGKARVLFQGPTPYAVSEAKDGETHTLVRGGKFPFACFVTPTGSKQEVGWTPEDPKAGGEHDVIPTS
ncbi:MAG: hypothetical protein JWP63_3318 [Candidatus Solibacter sp.]|nr:hypothetical protein [Candidatus Solibacter sp.]